MPKQPAFPGLRDAMKKKVTRREQFLAAMDAVVPWGRLLTLIEPHYPKAGPRGGRTNKFTLVAGLSSSGKSTWLTGNADKGKIIFPFKFGTDFSKLPEGSLIHYNTLRYADNSASNLDREFTHDPFMSEVLRHAGCFDLIYIAATLRELLRRIEVRHTVEDGRGVYPQDSIAAVIREIDHQAFHTAWLDLLVPVSRQAQFVLSNAQGFHVVSRRELIESMTKI